MSNPTADQIFHMLTLSNLSREQILSLLEEVKAKVEAIPQVRIS